MNTQTSQPNARVMITINGREVEALTPERLNQIVNGMKQKRMITAADDGEYKKGIRVIGDGNMYDGPIGLVFIYNTDVLSEVAFSGNKAQEALDALNAALDAADGDTVAIHNACRSYLNAITVSFSERTQKYENGDMIQGQVELVTTERGSLLTLRKTSLQKAEAIKAKAGVSFDLTSVLAQRKALRATELKHTDEPTGGTTDLSGASKVEAGIEAANKQQQELETKS